MNVFNNMGNAWVVLLKVSQCAKSHTAFLSQLHKLSVKITMKLLVNKKIGSRHEDQIFLN